MNFTTYQTKKLGQIFSFWIVTLLKKRIALLLLLALYFFPGYNYAQQNLPMGKEFFAKNKTKLKVNDGMAQALTNPVWLDNLSGHSYCNYATSKDPSHFTNSSDMIAYAYGNTDQSTNFHLAAIENMEAKLDGGSTCGAFTDDVWFFGETPGCTGKGSEIIFNNDGQGGKVAVNGNGISKVCSWENSLSVSAPGCDGSLIFYSQHNQLFNAKHEPMKNGAFSGHTSVADGLAACYIGSNKYMLFAVNTAYESGHGVAGLDYHIVDMGGDGGLGEKISSTSIEPNGVSESIELIPVAGTTNDYWLVYRMQSAKEMRVRKISGGVVSGVLSTLSLAAYDSEGYVTYTLRANNTFTMLGLVYPSTANVLFFNFNNTTGVISIKDYTINTGVDGIAYGLEFSPDSKYAYFSAWNLATSKISQYDIAAKTWSTPIEYGGLGGGMKVGPDGKIYVMRYGRYLGVIPNPNQPLTPANYIKEGFDLGAGTEENIGLALSTGLTVPAICPSGLNTAPICSPDEADAWRFPNAVINVLKNDTDPEGNILILSEAHFTNAADASKATLTINPTDSTVILSINPSYNFVDGEKIHVTYTVRDNGIPIALCEQSTVTFTLRKTVSCDVFSDLIWYFGEQMGIHFDKTGSGNYDYTAKGIPNSSLVASAENTLTITGSGSCGNSVIFYSQHNQIFTNNNQLMPSGSFSGHSSVNDGQAACFIGNNKYFFFAVSSTNFSGGLYYYQVDMNLNNGLGQVISTPTANEIEAPNTVSESIELIAVSGTTNEYWLIYNTANSIKVRKVTPSGVGPVLNTYSLGALYGEGWSSLRSNKEGNLLSISYPQGNIHLAKFNPITGTIDKIVRSNAFIHLYNTCFSPSNQYLYATAWTSDNKLYQYAIDPTTLQLSLVGTTPQRTTANGGGMKLGPDNKIYVNNGMGSQYAGVIKTPDLAITNGSFSYVMNGLDLGKITTNSLNAGHGMITFSTGITRPSVCPGGANQPPVTVADNADFCDGGQLCVDVVQNDSDPDPGNVLHLSGASFYNLADSNRLTLTFDPLTSKVCIASKAGATFTAGETIKISYIIRDSGNDPVPQCAEGTLTLTVISSTYIPTLTSKSYVACSGAIVNMTIQPTVGYTYAWYDAAIGGTLLGTGTSYNLTKDNSAIQSVWIESIPISGTICKRTRVDVILSSYCGGTTPTGCSATGSLIYREDFKGNNSTDPLVSPTDLIGGRSDLVFNGSNPGSGNYGLVKYQTHPIFLYNDDHTVSEDRTRGYLMYIDPAPSQMDATLYEYDILNLCAGTSNMSFTVWMVDLQTANTRPKIEMLILDKNTGDTLVTTGTFMIPRQPGPGQTAGNPAVWRQYGFDFSLPTGVSDITFRLTNKEVNNIGNDWAIDDVEIRLCAPPVTVSGTSNYCPGENINLAANYTDDGTFGGAQQTRWIYSTTGDLTSFASWSEVGTGTTLNKSMVAGYYRSIVGIQGNLDSKRYNCCAISPVIQVGVVPNLMYWDKAAANNNWNDPNNWVDALGVALNAVPRTCTDVHIPGNANFYPSLDLVNTVRTDTYGEPECRNITYHFGSEVAKPHFLTYSKAYIQYNFGYYDGSTYKTDGDPHSAAPMERDRWYALAAPLKKIVSGDFSVGGFPNMWQEGYHTTPGHSSDLWGEWYEPENTNALEIGAGQHYSICIWGGDYLPAVLGENNHTNLNTLQGIFEMPYFENGAVNISHRIHDYNSVTKTSTFKYYRFKIPGLPIDPEVTPGSIVRGAEAYRHVIEDASNVAQNDFKVTVPAGDEVLIGNVFLSSLDFVEFYNRNSAVIENYYRLYVNNNWETYNILTGSLTLTKDIASFQGFLIKTKGVKGSKTDIYFPMSASVTRPSSSAHQLKSSSTEELPDNVLYLKAKSAKGNSWATIGANVFPEENHVSKMFAKKREADGSLQLYTLGKDHRKNTIQYEFGGEIEIPFGVLCDTLTDITLSIENKDRLNAMALTLEDTKSGNEFNLFEMDELTFVCDTIKGERFKLRIGRANAPTGIEQAGELSLNVYTSGKTLHVYASKEILEVTVMTLQGVKVHSASVHQTSYVKNFPVSTGTYIVMVKMKDGEMKTVKVMMK